MIDGLPNATVYGQASGVFPWPPPLRSKPLPAFPGPVDYPTTLSFTPPNFADVNFVRAGFCNKRVPGMPLKPDMAGYTLNPQPNPPLVMDLDIFKYKGDLDSQNKFFTLSQTQGLPHLQVSLGHAVEQGWTIPEVVDFVTRWRSIYGGFADVWFFGGAWGDRDRDWTYWQPIWQPWIDALAPLMDCYCVGWQLDGANSPMGLLTIIRGLGAAIRKVRGAMGLPSIKASCHWINDACAWWDDDTAKLNPPIRDRFDFHRVLGAEDNLHRDYAQCDVNAPPAGPQGGFQGNINDLNRAHVMTPQGMQVAVLYEQFAQAEFDDPAHNTDEYGCMRGYLSCCVPNGGYGNGAYRPDRSAV